MTKAKNKDISIVIIEDEVHNSRLLQGLINKLRTNWNIEAILESIEESVKWFNSNSAPNLVLMDIQLSDGICFSIFEKIKFLHHVVLFSLLLMTSMQYVLLR